MSNVELALFDNWLNDYWRMLGDLHEFSPEDLAEHSVDFAETMIELRRSAIVRLSGKEES